MAQSFTCSRCRTSVTIHHKADLTQCWRHLENCQLAAQCQLCGAPGGNCPACVSELRDDW